MQLSISKLTTERKWRAATGLTQARFNTLLHHFKQAYARIFALEITERDSFAIHESIIKTEEELLFFTLFSLKCGLTYDLLGLVSGMDNSNAKRYQERGISVLQEALANSCHLPKREFKNVAEFNAYFSQHEVLFVDGTEQRTQRPADKETQKDWYSGKKKTHSLKGIVISLKSRWIGFLSRFQPGKNHDYSLLKKLFPADKEWFKKFTVRLDLGFLGFATAYCCRQCVLPIKKPKGKDLTEQQRAVNQEQAKERVIVEHAIGGLKRYRILSDRLRMRDLEYYDEILGVCAGLWNFYISH